jgi:hypothetical protein
MHQTQLYQHTSRNSCTLQPQVAARQRVGRAHMHLAQLPTQCCCCSCYVQDPWSAAIPPVCQQIHSMCMHATRRYAVYLEQ